MRRLISGVVAAMAVATAGASPAMACGGGLFQSSCSPCGGVAYVSPCGGYGGYGYNGGYGYGGGYAYSGGYASVAAYQMLPRPTAQYYYVNQGPVYSGAGNYAPYPTYQETAVSGWRGYDRGYQVGYDGGPYGNATTHYSDVGYGGPAVYSYRHRPSYRPWRPRASYYGHPRPSYRYGVRPQVRYGYAPRYGISRHQYGGYGHRPLRRMY